MFRVCVCVRLSLECVSCVCLCAFELRVCFMCAFEFRVCFMCAFVFRVCFVCVFEYLCVLYNFYLISLYYHLIFTLFSL